MNIASIFPLRVVYGRLTYPKFLRAMYRKAETKSPSCTKKGPGRKHKQGQQGVWA